MEIFIGIVLLEGFSDNDNEKKSSIIKEGSRNSEFWFVISSLLRISLLLIFVLEKIGIENYGPLGEKGKILQSLKLDNFAVIFGHNFKLNSKVHSNDNTDNLAQVLDPNANLTTSKSNPDSSLDYDFNLLKEFFPNNIPTTMDQVLLDNPNSKMYIFKNIMRNGSVKSKRGNKMIPSFNFVKVIFNDSFRKIITSYITDFKKSSKTFF
jgi:hypothetical protein